MAWRLSCSENIQHNLMIVSSTYPWPSSSTVDDLNLNGNITHEDSQFLSQCMIWLMHETLLWNTRFEAITELATSPRVLYYQKPNEIALVIKATWLENRNLGNVSSLLVQWCFKPSNVLIDMGLSLFTVLLQEMSGIHYTCRVHRMSYRKVINCVFVAIYM